MDPILNLGDDYQIDEDGDRFVIRHKPSGAEFEYNPTTDEWNLGNLGATSVSTEVINSVPQPIYYDKLDFSNSASETFTPPGNATEVEIKPDLRAGENLELWLRVGGSTNEYKFFEISSAGVSFKDTDRWTLVTTDRNSASGSWTLKEVRSRPQLFGAGAGGSHAGSEDWTMLLSGAHGDSSIAIGDTHEILVKDSSGDDNPADGSVEIIAR